MELPDIKQRLSINTVLQHYGLEANKHNMLCCPFHKEQEPSLKVYTDTNTFYCFGCRVTGDQVEFIQLKEKCSKHAAILKAKEILAVPTDSVGKALLKATELCNGSTTTKPKTSKTTSISETERKAILEKVFATFRKGVRMSPKPKEYLQSRNLNYELLEVGYNSGQFHHRGNLSEQEIKSCVNVGLLIPYTGTTPNATGISYTPFAKDCVIFPLKDRQNQVVSFYGRSITNNKNSTAQSGTSKHYYLKNRQGLYPHYPKPDTIKLILTEAIIDAATLLQIPEITNEYEVLSCYGTNGLTAEHKQAIKELEHLEEIIFFFDGDHSAEEAINKYQEELNELLLPTLRSGQAKVRLTKVETPENEDINSLSISHEQEVFTYLINNRKELFFLNEKTKPGTGELTGPVPIEASGSVEPKPAEPSAGKLNTKNAEYITYTTEELQIIILGGINLQQLDRLRITLKITRNNTNNPLHSIRHTLDLYHSDYLEKFINKASEQLETGTNVIRMALAELTEQIENHRLNKLESLKEQKPKERQLTEQRYKKAIHYLKAPKLMERTNQDIGRTGMIGEENNRLLMYLVFTSRLREQPLHIISLGASGTGKTYLQEKISELIPEQDKLEITILSENAFYYFDRKELKNKLVLIEDMDGAENVLYPLRELQSKKRISKTIPIKDNKGNLKTITLQVEGPICLAGTTTKEKLYEDNANRSLLIYLDNTQEHKEHIMSYQRKLSAGKIATKQENELKEFFKDMQTILKPIKVRNPFAELLVIPEHVFKPLRTNSHYLAFIETITFYHQYQREIKIDPATNERYIETTLEDIEWANKLLKDVILAKSDELTKAERSFFESLKSWVKSNNQESFYAKEVRETFRMHPSKVKRYLNNLLRYNLIKVVGGNRYKSGLEYEITNTEEYKKLESAVNTVLDNVLENIRQKMSGSGGLHVGYGQNRPLNGKNASKLMPVVQ